MRIVRDGDSSKDIDAHLSKIENDGEKKKRSETLIAKLCRQTREIETEQWSRIERKWR